MQFFFMQENKIFNAWLMVFNESSGKHETTVDSYRRCASATTSKIRVRVLYTRLQFISCSVLWLLQTRNPAKITQPKQFDVKKITTNRTSTNRIEPEKNNATLHKPIKQTNKEFNFIERLQFQFGRKSNVDCNT